MNYFVLLSTFPTCLILYGIYILLITDICYIHVSSFIFVLYKRNSDFTTDSFLLSGSISNIDGAEYHCNKTQVRKVISGVVGAASSVTSVQVANLLRLFKIPQVSK